MITATLIVGRRARDETLQQLVRVVLHAPSLARAAAHGAGGGRRGSAHAGRTRTRGSGAQTLVLHGAPGRSVIFFDLFKIS